MNLHNADIRFMGLPAWALAVAGALCVALLIVYWRYVRRVAFPRPLLPLFLRFLALGSVLLLAANPALFITSKKPVPRRIAIMVDRSQSMSLADTPGGATRYERALAAAQSLGKSLDTARTWTFAFSGEGAPADLPELAAQRALGRTTFLMDSLDDPDTGEGLPLTDVVVITDGRDNSGMAPAPPPQSARIHAVGLGAPGPDINVSLGDVQAPEFAFVNKPVTLEGDVWLAGMDPGREITVELMSHDKRLGASTLKALGPDLSGHAWSLQFTPREVGLHTLTVRARAGDLAETVTQDNERPVFINVMSGRRKVLIVDTPRWDFAFLNRMLTAQDKIEINTLLFTERGVQGNVPRGAIGSQARLAEYSLVIFGAAGRAATQAERGALLTYLRRGGSVILLGGANSLFDTPDTQWQALIKRTAPSGANSGQAFYPALTPAGRGNPLLRVLSDPDANAAHWAALPYLYTFHALAAPQGADVLAEHPWASCAGRKCPLILALKADRGRLLMLPVQGLWRWRLARTEDATFETLWNNILSVLMEPEETRPVRLVLPKRYYPLGAEICFEARIDPAAARAAAPTMSITQEDRTVASLPLNPRKDSEDFYTACFNPSDPGIYKVEARAGAETSGAEPFAVTVAREEFVTSSLNSKLLKTLATQTGGAYVNENQLTELADTLNKPGAFLDVREEHSLWRTPWCWYVLGFILGILSLEWILRRRGGLT